MNRDQLKSRIKELVLKEVSRNKASVITEADGKRQALKEVIRKLVLQEITRNEFGTPDVSTDDEGVKVIEKVLGKGADAKKVAGSSKTIGVTPSHTVELYKQSNGCYDVISVTNGEDRKIAKNLKLEDVGEFLKKHAADSEKTYQQKAYDKSKKGFGIEKKEDKKKDESDKMEDVKEKTQTDISDKTDVKAEEKGEKDLAPVDDDLSAQMGGELVDKIERIMDKVLKSKTKAETKTAYLKTDKDMESTDKLAVKLDGTNAIKGAKSKEKITPKVKAVDSKK
jgi:hypothetical protein